MSPSNEFDVGPLTWVKGEIDAALNAARERLEEALADITQREPLRFAQTHVHQASGALSIVGLDGVSQFSESIDKLLSALAAGELPVTTGAVTLLIRSVGMLGNYVNEVAAGAPHQPLRLYPAYRDVVLARGAEAPSASELFFPDLSVRPRLDSVEVLDPERAAHELRVLRVRFEKGLLNWLRKPQSASGPQEMLSAVQRIEQIQSQPATRAFWWSSIAFFEGLALQAIPADRASQRLCRRIDTQMRRLLEGSQVVAERLVRDVLYFVATAGFDSTQARAVRQVYGLDRVLPGADVELSDTLRQPFAPRVKEALEHAKEAWNRFSSGMAAALPQFQDQLAELGNRLQPMHIPQCDRLLASLTAAIDWLRTDPLRLTDDFAMEVATSLLVLEQAIESPNADPALLRRQVDLLGAQFDARRQGLPVTELDSAPFGDASRRAQERQFFHQLAREILTNLGQIEQSLDNFFRNPAERGALGNLGGPLKQIEGAFAVLGEMQAVALVSASANEIQRFATQNEVPPPAEFDALAHQLSALGFYVEALKSGPANLERFLNPSAEVTEREVDVPREVTVEDQLQRETLEAKQLLDALRAAPEDQALRQQLVSNLESIREDAQLVADSGLEQKAREALASLKSGEASQEKIAAAFSGEAPAAMAAPVAAPVVTATEQEVDAELLEIFLEEAVEVLATIASNRDRISARSNDMESMTTVRRGYHTLKGSSRMVGLVDFSEAARHVEMAMNRWLQMEREADASLLSLIDHGRECFSVWVEQLQSGGSLYRDASALIDEATALLASLDAPAGLAPAPAVAAPLAAAAAVVAADDVPASMLQTSLAPEGLLASADSPEPTAPQDAELDLTSTLLDLASLSSGDDQDTIVDLAVTDFEGDALRAFAEEYGEEAGAAAADDQEERFAAPAGNETSLGDGFDLDFSLDEFDLGEPAAPDSPASLSVDTGHDDAADAPAAGGSDATPPFELDLGASLVLPDLDDFSPDRDHGQHFDVLATRLSDETLMSLDDADTEPEMPLLAEPLDLSAGRPTDSGEMPAPIETLEVPGLPGSDIIEAELPVPATAADASLPDDDSLADTPIEELVAEALDAHTAGSADAPEELPEEEFFEIAIDEIEAELALEQHDEAAAPAVLGEETGSLDDLETLETIEVSDAAFGLDQGAPLAPADQAAGSFANEAAQAEAEAEAEAEAAPLVDALIDLVPGADTPTEALQAFEATLDEALPDNTAEAEEASDTPPSTFGAEPEADFGLNAGPAEEAAAPELFEIAIDEFDTDPDFALPVINLDTPAEVQAPAPAFTDAEVSIGDQVLSRGLYDLYVGEARQLLNQLTEEQDRLLANPIRVPMVDAIRAAHTLAGISGTAHIEPAYELGKALEHALHRFAEVNTAPLASQTSVLGTAVLTLDGMLTEVLHYIMPRPAPELIEQLRELTPPSADDTDNADDAGSVTTDEAGVEDSAAMADDTPDVPFSPEPVIAPATRQDADDAEAPSGPQDELDEQLLEIFFEEADELSAAIAAVLRDMRANPADSAAHQSLARHLHTYKGSARMAGAMRLGQYIHNVESHLEHALLHNQADTALVDELENNLDHIGAQIHALKNPQAAVAEPVAAEVAEVADVPVEVASDAAAADDTASAPVFAPAAPAPAPAPAPVFENTETVQVQQRAPLRVKAEMIDRFVNEAGEVSIARTRIEGELRTLRRSLLDLTENVIRLRNQLREVEIQAESQMQSRIAQAESTHANFDPLEFDRFTRLQELTRMMAESVGDVTTIQQNLLRNIDGADAALHAQGRLSRDLQQALMSVRMVPFEELADRLYRVVRQTSKELGKRVNLDIQGGSIEIDRGVLDRMTAPLEHLLRNSIAHGIEPPDLRAAAGKPEFGQITLRLTQLSNEIALELADDGKGLDYERILARGRANGLVGADEHPNENRLTQLIFEPGFSTAESVSGVAGRGVGMDVVKNETLSVGGRIEIYSVAQQGSRFLIHLPLTLAVTQALLVRSGERTYAIPSNMVEQALELKEGPLLEARARGYVEWKEVQYPLTYLPHLLGESNAQPVPGRYQWVLLVRAGNQPIAVHIDELRGNQEVVVKNAGPQFVRLQGYSGATVLADGEISLILNPVALAARRSVQVVGGNDAPVEDAAPAQARVPSIMVVDDSLTVRKITSRLLEREGFQVVTAKDGVDALEQLIEYKPDVMLLDIEMPRMDGFDLARNVRADARLKDVPIIMITSRMADKHRNYAKEIGVNEYLGKPYQEEQLLELITGFIAAQRSA